MSGPQPMRTATNMLDDDATMNSLIMAHTQPQPKLVEEGIDRLLPSSFEILFPHKAIAQCSRAIAVKR